MAEGVSSSKFQGTRRMVEAVSLADLFLSKGVLHTVNLLAETMKDVIFELIVGRDSHILAGKFDKKGSSALSMGNLNLM